MAVPKKKVSSFFKNHNKKLLIKKIKNKNSIFKNFFFLNNKNTFDLFFFNN